MPPCRPGESTRAATRRSLAAGRTLFTVLVVSGLGLACIGSLDGLSSGLAEGGAGKGDAGTEAGRPPDGAAALAPIAIDPPGRTFVGVQMVRILGGGPGRTIRYTTDGSLPSKVSRAYSGPFSLQASAVVRAVVEGPSMGSTGAAAPMTSAAFVQVREELTYWSSNLPVLVLHTHGSGTLPLVREAAFQPGTITVLEPAPPPGEQPAAPPVADQLRTRLVGTPTFTSRAGLRLRGESSLTFTQKSYAVELWSAATDLDSDQTLLGLPADSDYALVGPGYTDRSLMRNALAYALSNQIGRYAPRTRFVEVFVVEGGDTLREGDYRGVYTLAENIKRGPARVNISKLDASDLGDPAVTGGYSVRIDKGATHFSVGAFPFQFVYPRWEEIGQPEWAAQREYVQSFLTEFLEALAQPNYRHPRTSKAYSAYIDVPAFIDHNLLTVLFKNVDGLRLSAYFHKDRGGPLVAGPVWDFDRSSGTPHDADFSPTPRAAEPRQWAIGDGTHPLQWGFWGRLLAEPTFKTAHARRWAELARGPFSPENINQLIDRFTLELGAATSRHFARWPDLPPTGGSYESEIKLLKDWFAARIPWVSGQLTAGP